ncbi:hypothetical protein U9M48_038592 [Paspalum notatum var. saurae]|uniref:DDE Tnp4 domain-containing protein n=1 Tax=Paspalum notatum var. saurae TaxID=547442 RepID=A0AAQ3UIV9_PASNO
MQNCIGAIDGTHIRITIAGDKAAPYRNRKGTLSHNVMLACDFNHNFTFISCGWEGSASDAGSFDLLLAKGLVCQKANFILQYFDVPEGDNIFPNDTESSDESTLEIKLHYKCGLHTIVGCLYFDEKYHEACLSKQQLQKKEKELKSHYKAVRDSKKESGGAAWKQSMF